MTVSCKITKASEQQGDPSPASNISSRICLDPRRARGALQEQFQCNTPDKWVAARREGGINNTRLFTSGFRRYAQGGQIGLIIVQYPLHLTTLSHDECGINFAVVGGLSPRDTLQTAAAIFSSRLFLYSRPVCHPSETHRRIFYSSLSDLLTPGLY